MAPEPAPEGGWQQVSIFLSVVDVHVNRSPYRGTVTSTSYTPGSFLAAYRAESAHQNERSEIWLADGDRTVVFRQLVGSSPAHRHPHRRRRAAGAGERMGLMKFGSRMDVFLPADAELAGHQGPACAAARPSSPASPTPSPAGGDPR